jgi:mannan endo-1,4-beta-mannosidase
MESPAIAPAVRPGASAVEAFEPGPVGRPLPWVRLGPGRRYFETEGGEPFLIIGQNDALTWPELEGLLGRRDLPGVDRHLAWLKAHGVTTLRVMLEYVGDGLFLERSCGEFDPVTVQAVDDLVALCEQHGLRLLLTPFDTFFTWVMWDEHPYNAGRGGPCRDRIDLLTHPDGLAAVKARLAFAVRRWGGSGAVFAWDLWNELAHHHGVEGEEHVAGLGRHLIPIVSELSALVRGIERRQFGKTHLQTVSHFGPEPRGELAELVFRHPDLDFATTHVYEPGAIDAPSNTVAAADAMARWVRHALAEIRDGRPFTDSETGPIHTFKDLGVTLPEAFDISYFRHMSWAHLASGGAGGGMRWPNRMPHTLTPGMRVSQGVMADFARRIDWPRFAARNVSEELRTDPENLLAYGCADESQALVWVLRDRDELAREGDLPFRPLLSDARVEVPAMEPGRYRVTCAETHNGYVLSESVLDLRSGPAVLALPPFRHDLAVAVRPEGGIQAGSAGPTSQFTDGTG